MFDFVSIAGTCMLAMAGVFVLSIIAMVMIVQLRQRLLDLNAKQPR